jgi:hypothetical protein
MLRPLYFLFVLSCLHECYVERLHRAREVRSNIHYWNTTISGQIYNIDVSGMPVMSIHDKKCWVCRWMFHSSNEATSEPLCGAVYLNRTMRSESVPGEDPFSISVFRPWRGNTIKGAQQCPNHSCTSGVTRTLSQPMISKSIASCLPLQALDLCWDTVNPV